MSTNIYCFTYHDVDSLVKRVHVMGLFVRWYLVQLGGHPGPLSARVTQVHVTHGAKVRTVLVHLVVEGKPATPDKQTIQFTLRMSVILENYILLIIIRIY